MICWKYLVPRLIALVFAAGFLCFAFQPLAHWAVVYFGQLAIGAKVDVSDLEISLAEMDLRLQGVAIADPSSPERNVFQATEMVIDLDRPALLQRQLVVREGRISGLRFSTQRDTSGRLETRDDDSADGAGEFNTRWLQVFSDRLKEDIESDLDTVRVVNELKIRWPEEYRQLEQRADAVEVRIRRLRDAVQRARTGDILRDPGMIQQATLDIDAVRKELESLPGEVRRLRDQVDRDRQAIELAKQHDIQYLKERFRWEHFDAETLSRYLLKNEEAAQVHELLAWIEWGRQFVPQKREFTEPDRGRGWKIRFRGLPDTPDWLFERLAVDGVASRNGQELPFAGELRDVTWQQAIVGRPTTLDIHTLGETPLAIHAVLDRRSAEPVDHFVIDCPTLPLKGRTLGRPDKLAFDVAPADASIRLEIELRGDQVDGQLVYRQDRLQMQAASEGQLSQRLVQRLNQGASQVQQATVTVSLTGPVTRPRMHLDTDLGDQLCAGFNLAFQAELNDRADQLRSKLDQVVQKQLNDAQQRVDAKVQELLARLDGPRQELTQLAQSLPSVRGLAESLNLPDAVRKASFPWPEPWRR